MHSMLVQYHGKYYVYKGVADGKMMADEDIALAISTYESVFCADIVASYVFKMTEISFLCARYGGMYHSNR
eukprot:5559411-Ditylum_brightwellii.AAC.1